MKTLILLLLPIILHANGVFLSVGKMMVSTSANQADPQFYNDWNGGSIVQDPAGKTIDYRSNVNPSNDTHVAPVIDFGFNYEKDSFGVDVGMRYIGSINFNTVTDTYTVTFPCGCPGNTYTYWHGTITNEGSLQSSGPFISPYITDGNFKLGLTLGDLLSYGNLDVTNFMDEGHGGTVLGGTIIDRYNLSANNIFYQPYVEFVLPMGDFSVSLNFAYMMLNISNLQANKTETDNNSINQTGHNTGSLPHRLTVMPFSADFSGQSLSLKAQYNF